MLFTLTFIVNHDSGWFHPWEETAHLMLKVWDPLTLYSRSRVSQTLCTYRVNSFHGNIISLSPHLVDSSLRSLVISTELYIACTVFSYNFIENITSDTMNADLSKTLKPLMWQQVKYCYCVYILDDLLVRVSLILPTSLDSLLWLHFYTVSICILKIWQACDNYREAWSRDPSCRIFAIR
jgi:hypothetical protein